MNELIEIFLPLPSQNGWRVLIYSISSLNLTMETLQIWKLNWKIWKIILLIHLQTYDLHFWDIMQCKGERDLPYLHCRYVIWVYQVHLHNCWWLIKVSTKFQGIQYSDNIPAFSFLKVLNTTFQLRNIRRRHYQ